jgi:hypothetical protein
VVSRRASSLFFFATRGEIRMGLETGMAAALVLTGETTAEDLATLAPENTPGIVVDRIDRLLPPDVWQELGWSEAERV